MSKLIGPLTAEEWCSFRLRTDDPDQDILFCCGTTSDIRDDIFHVLRSGVEDYHKYRIIHALRTLADHGPLSEEQITPALVKLSKWCGFDPEKFRDHS